MKTTFLVILLAFGSVSCSSSAEKKEVPEPTAATDSTGAAPMSAIEGANEARPMQGILPLGDMAWRCEITVGEKTFEGFGRRKNIALNKVKRECAVQNGARPCANVMCRQNN